MSENVKMTTVPDKVLDAIAGGALSNYDRRQFQSTSEALKERGLPYKSAMGWWHQQLQSCHYSDEDWQEIEQIVKSVYDA